MSSTKNYFKDDKEGQYYTLLKNYFAQTIETQPNSPAMKFLSNTQFELFGLHSKW